MKLHNKIALWISLIIILCLAATGYLGAPLVERLLFAQTADIMRIATKHASHEIEKWFETRHVLLASIATDLEAQRILPDDPGLKPLLSLHQSRLHRYFDYIFIGFENQKIVSTRTSPLPPGFDPTLRPWFRETLLKQGLVVTEPYPDRLTGEMVTTMALPVAVPVAGVLASDINLSDLMLLSRNAVFRAEADVFLISASNQVLYSTNSTLEQRGKRLGPISPERLETVLPSSRSEGSQLYFNMERNQTRYLLIISPIPTPHWQIGVAIPFAVLNAERNILMTRILTISVASLLLILLLTYASIRRFTRPLTNLAQTAHDLESGNVDVHFAAKGSQEIENLANSLEKMRLSQLRIIDEKDGLLRETNEQNLRIQELFVKMKDLNIELEKANKEKSVLYTQTIQALSESVDAKDHYTHGHSNRVLLLCEIVGTILNWDAKTLEKLRYAAILHDIGKIGVPEEILNKNSALTCEEFEVIKNHPIWGARILQNIQQLDEVREAILQHHEYMDGSGYPLGIKGENITILARLIAIADAYDAMTSERPYRPALSVREAYENLRRGSGSQFDPELLEVFFLAIPDIEENINGKK